LLAGEDFAFYSRKVPSMFYFLGAKDDADQCFFVHHPKVIVNEDCIKYGAEFLCNAAIRLLESE
jgi:metal-dependent amidase/aminoacylase/carboxypeptidase family protein